MKFIVYLNNGNLKNGAVAHTLVHSWADGCTSVHPPKEAFMSFAIGFFSSLLVLAVWLESQGNFTDI